MRNDDLGRKNYSLNLINQQFESIQPDDLLSCDTSSPNGQIGVQEMSGRAVRFLGILFKARAIAPVASRYSPQSAAPHLW
jgi:hypothetical protein